MPTILEASKVSAAAAISECDRCSDTGNHEEIRQFLDAYDNSPSHIATVSHIVSTLADRPPPMEASLALAAIEAVGRFAHSELATNNDMRKATGIVTRCRLVDIENKAHCMLRDSLVAELHVAVGDMQAERALDNTPALADIPSSEIRVRSKYLTVVASILDRKRRFLDAATKYYAAAKTSQLVASTVLPKAFVCAMLAPQSERQRSILKQLAADECRKLLGNLAPVVQRAHKQQLLRTAEADAIRHIATEAHNSPMYNGKGLLDAAIIRYNIHAVAAVYYNITIAELSAALGVSEDDAEAEVHTMILSGALAASIDQGNGLIAFQADAAAPLREWDETINAVCVDVAAVADAIERQHPTLAN